MVKESMITCQSDTELLHLLYSISFVYFYILINNVLISYYVLMRYFMDFDICFNFVGICTMMTTAASL